MDQKPDQDGSLRRIEEAIAFGEHQQEALSREMIDLAGRVEEVAHRLARLEARLSGSLEALDARLREAEGGAESEPAGSGEE